MKNIRRLNDERKVRWREAIEEIEALRVEWLLLEGNPRLQASRAGRSVDEQSAEVPGMKERYLEALSTYGNLGLTPEELYVKRRIWLWHPSDTQPVTTRPKTISMFLHRLKKKGLANRQREGQTFRYFSTINGENRLDYYKKHRAKLTRAHKLI